MGATPWVAAFVVWAVLFALPSFYWAAGGHRGASTIGPALADPVLDRDPGMVTLVWASGVAKLAAGGLAGALLVRSPARLALWLRWAAWLVGAGLLLYGVANLAQHTLVVTDVVDVPDGRGDTAARWHLALWDPPHLPPGGAEAWPNGHRSP